MNLMVIGQSIDIMRLVMSLMLLAQLSVVWLTAEPIMARAMPALPLPQRTAGQRVMLYGVAAIAIVLAFAVIVLLDPARTQF